VILVAEPGSCNGWLAMCEQHRESVSVGQVGVQIIPCSRSVTPQPHWFTFLCNWRFTAALRRTSQQFTH